MEVGDGTWNCNDGMDDGWIGCDGGVWKSGSLGVWEFGSLGVLVWDRRHDRKGGK